MQIGPGCPQRGACIAILVALIKRRGEKGKRPTVIFRQLRETRHGRAGDAMRNDLLKGEDAALACPVMIGQDDWPRRKRGGQSTIGMSTCAMACGALGLK